MSRILKNSLDQATPSHFTHDAFTFHDNIVIEKQSLGIWGMIIENIYYAFGGRTPIEISMCKDLGLTLADETPPFIQQMMEDLTEELEINKTYR